MRNFLKNKLFYICTFLGFIFSTHALAGESKKDHHGNILEKYGFPAFTIVELKAGKLKQLTMGKRSVLSKSRAKRSDQWHLGSATKSLSALLIGHLIEKYPQKLSWTKTLPEYFPELSIHKDYHLVTFKELLSHRSGLQTSNELDQWYQLDQSKKPSQARWKLVSGVLQEPSQVNSKSNLFVDRYSNVGYITAAVVVEKVLDKSWEATVENELFGPLRMQECEFYAYGFKQSKKPQQPVGHFYDENLKSSEVASIQELPKFMSPAGLIRCSMKSWSKFIRVYADAAKNHYRYVSKDTIDILLSDEDHDYYAVGGLMTFKDPIMGRVYFHNGSNQRNASVFLINLDQDVSYFGAMNVGDKKGVKPMMRAFHELFDPWVGEGHQILPFDNFNKLIQSKID